MTDTELSDDGTTVTLHLSPGESTAFRKILHDAGADIRRRKTVPKGLSLADTYDRLRLCERLIVEMTEQTGSDDREETAAETFGRLTS